MADGSEHAAPRSGEEKSSKHDSLNHDSSKHDSSERVSSKHDSSEHESSKHNSASNHDSSKHDSLERVSSKLDSSEHDSSKHNSASNHDSSSKHDSSKHTSASKHDSTSDDDSSSDNTSKTSTSSSSTGESLSKDEIKSFESEQAVGGSLVYGWDQWKIGLFEKLSTRKTYKTGKENYWNKYEGELKSFQEMEANFAERLGAYLKEEVNRDNLTEHLSAWKKQLVNHTYEVKVVKEGKQILLTKPKQVKTKGTLRKTFTLKKNKTAGSTRDPMLDELCFKFEEMYEQLDDLIKALKAYAAHATNPRKVTLYKASSRRNELMIAMHTQIYSDAQLQEYNDRLEENRIKKEAKLEKREERRVKEEQRAEKAKKRNPKKMANFDESSDEISSDV